MKAKLLHLTRWLRGLGTCQDCGGPTIGGKCPACMQAMAVAAANLMCEIHGRNQLLSTENQMLSRRLMIHDLKAAKERCKESP